MKIYPKEAPSTEFFYVLFVLLVCVYLYHAGQSHLRSEATQAAMTPSLQRTQPAPKLPDGVGQMIGKYRMVFVGEQINAEQLTEFLATYDIRHVIDLANEAKAEKILPNREERFIVEKTGATYWPFNIEGENDRLNQVVLATIDSLVDTGLPVFVHCRNGIHRVGVVKGRAYARDGRRWKEVVALLRWEKVVIDAKYDSYTNDVWEAVQALNQPPTFSQR
jgi:hypothetical protein